MKSLGEVFWAGRAAREAQSSLLRQCQFCRAPVAPGVHGSNGERCGEQIMLGDGAGRKGAERGRCLLTACAPAGV